MSSCVRRTGLGYPGVPIQPGSQGRSAEGWGEADPRTSSILPVPAHILTRGSQEPPLGGAESSPTLVTIVHEHKP